MFKKFKEKRAEKKAAKEQAKLDARAHSDNYERPVWPKLPNEM